MSCVCWDWHVIIYPLCVQAASPVSAHQSSRGHTDYRIPTNDKRPMQSDRSVAHADSNETPLGPRHPGKHKVIA